ncbi:hypothetical protein IJG44_10055 [bacterium]|nr:hypothetical protein [bacterium]
MKKFALFFTVFLIFGFLIAEDVQKEPVSVENEIKTESEARQKKEKQPKFFHIQPMVEAGIGRGGEDDIIYGFFSTNIDFSFLVANIKRRHNIYVGFGFGVKYAHSLYKTVEIPVQSKIVFDFKTNTPYKIPEYASLWFALGGGVGRYDIDYIIAAVSGGKELDPEWTAAVITWGVGTDLTFENGLVLQIAVESFFVIGLMPTIGLGYRF